MVTRQGGSGSYFSEAEDSQESSAEDEAPVSKVSTLQLRRMPTEDSLVSDRASFLSLRRTPTERSLDDDQASFLPRRMPTERSLENDQDGSDTASQALSWKLPRMPTEQTLQTHPGSSDEELASSASIGHLWRERNELQAKLTQAAMEGQRLVLQNEDLLKKLNDLHEKVKISDQQHEEQLEKLTKEFDDDIKKCWDKERHLKDRIRELEKEKKTLVDEVSKYEREREAANSSSSAQLFGPTPMKRNSKIDSSAASPKDNQLDQEKDDVDEYERKIHDLQTRLKQTQEEKSRFKQEASAAKEELRASSEEICGFAEIFDTMKGEAAEERKQYILNQERSMGETESDKSPSGKLIRINSLEAEINDAPPMSATPSLKATFSTPRLSRAGSSRFMLNDALLSGLRQLQEVVRLRLVVEGISYDNLTKDATLKISFEAAVKKAIAGGRAVGEQDIFLELSRGSVIIKATISTNPDQKAALELGLEERKQELEKAIKEGVCVLPGIDAIQVGPIDVKAYLEESYAVAESKMAALRQELAEQAARLQGAEQSFRSAEDKAVRQQEELAEQAAVVARLEEVERSLRSAEDRAVSQQQELAEQADVVARLEEVERSLRSAEDKAASQQQELAEHVELAARLESAERQAEENAEQQQELACRAVAAAQREAKGSAQAQALAKKVEELRGALAAETKARTCMEAELMRTLVGIRRIDLELNA